MGRRGFLGSLLAVAAACVAGVQRVVAKRFRPESQLRLFSYGFHRNDAEDPYPSPGWERATTGLMPLEDALEQMERDTMRKRRMCSGVFKGPFEEPAWLTRAIDEGLGRNT